MFHNVVVGVDDRPGGRDAIALAQPLLAEDGVLALAHVHGGDARLATISPEMADDERTRSRQLLDAVRSATGVDARLVSTGSWSVGRGLHELAERRGADLLVVGSSGASLMGRARLADHTRAALNGAPCAVAVAPAGYADRPVLIREIGVGYDGSADSERALEVARGLADDLAAKLSAFQAIALPVHLLREAGLAEEAIDGHLASARERIGGLGEVEAHVAYGDASEELALYGASVDLLIIGSRGYGPVGRLMHGSTSLRLAQTARCPLLVLPRTSRRLQEPDEEELGRDQMSAPS